MSHSKRIKKTIGFVIEGFPLPYNYVSASVRLRVYDVIQSFRNHPNFSLELYRPWKKYDLVFLQRRDVSSFALAKKLHKIKTKIVLDINANIFDKSLYGKGFLKKLNDVYFNNLCEITKMVDYISITSPYLEQIINKQFPNKKTVLLEENIHDVFFEYRKSVPRKNNTINLLYVGYSGKACQIYLIKSQLEKLAKKYKIHYILICEKDPRLKIDGVQFEFIPFKNRGLQEKMLLGDIFLAPRDMLDSYNLAHSFTKIGLPMSVGVPVIASPVPSYRTSPAILLNSFGDEWIDTIEKIFLDKEKYKKISENGIRYCRNNFSQDRIRQKYNEFFNEIL